MVKTKLLFHARFFKLAVLFCWLSSLASVSAETSMGPDCIQVLSEINKNCDADPVRRGSPFYSVSCRRIVKLPSAFCEFFSNKRLRIELQRFAPVTHVLLKEPFVGKYIRNVTVWNGITFRECKYLPDPVSTDLDGQLNNKQRFSKFSCGDSNGPTGLFMANAIDINSIVHRTVDLTSLQTTGQLDWMVLMHAGTAADYGAFAEKKPTVMESSGERVHYHHAIDSSQGTFGNDWNETKRNNTIQPSDDGKPSNKCPPINPYHGMPEKYKNYQLVSDGSINDLLLTKPCRHGYKLVGIGIGDISQCKSGTWQGKGFPKCEVMITSTPPNVEHATWDYVHNDTFHEIVYVCDDGYDLVPSGTGMAIHRPETDEWVGVPQCQQQPLPAVGTGGERFIQDQHWLIICAIAACTIGAPLSVVIVVLRIKNRKLKHVHMTPAAVYDYVLPNNNARHDYNIYEEIKEETRPLHNVQSKQPDVLLAAIKTDKL